MQYKGHLYKSGTDFNNYTKTGRYTFAAIDFINGPGFPYGTLDVKEYGSYLLQVAYQRGTTSHGIKYRFKEGNEWQDWTNS